MSYKINIEKKAVKFLAKQPKQQRVRLLKAIYKLPDEGDIKNLKGLDNCFRLRVGSYRVIYLLDNSILVINVIEIGNRGDIYK